MRRHPLCCTERTCVTLGLRAAKKGAPKAERSPEEAAALAAFDEVTEAASALMDAGELDVYGATREEFERAAAAFPAPGADEDMFGDEDDDMRCLLLPASATPLAPLVTPYVHCLQG